MNTFEKQTNEKYFLNLMRMTNNWIWVNKSNSYSFSSNKMKPETLKGYVELSSIVRKEFMDLFVELPDDTNGMSKEMIWNIINRL